VQNEHFLRASSFAEGMARRDTRAGLEGFTKCLDSWSWGAWMSGSGKDFLKDWINRNITETDRPGSRELATILAARCRGEAASKGIGLAELEPEFVTVEMAIYEAMQNDPHGGTPAN
jgi:hypothetical protein